MLVQQKGGDHYGGHEFQHWDMVAVCGTDYFAGVASKYLLRWRSKGGVQDLQKSITYIDKLIVSEVQPTGNPVRVEQTIARYLKMNKLSDDEARASRLLFGWQTYTDLHEAREIIKRIIQEEVCSWPEMDTLLDTIKPDGWQGFTFEGLKEGRTWFRCTTCRMRFHTGINAPPTLAHECSGIRPIYSNDDEHTDAARRAELDRQFGQPHHGHPPEGD